MKNRGSFFTILIGLVIAGQFVIMNHKLLSTRRNLSKRIKKCRKGQKALIFALNKTVPLAFSLPKQMNQVSYADQEIVFDVKDVQIRGVFAPYNASLIENDEEGYLLFFRYDQVKQMHFNFFDTHIGLAWLNEDFDQIERDYLTIDTQSCHSEDPRILKNENDFYLVYNDGPFDDARDRKMHIAKLNPETFQPEVITKLNPHLCSIEKNWVPFSHNNQVHFEYQIFSPRKILKLEHPSRPTLLHIDYPLKNESIEWEEKWGKPLGGSSARLVDGQYLAFFHSKFQDRMGTYWYVMGAYTFEPESPFRVTAISKEPIVYKGIYQTRSINTADPQKFVIFPGGYAIKKYGSRTFLHLACGENDSAVKIVTIDKDRLLQSLVPIEN